MPISSAHAAVFYQEVARNRRLSAIRDKEGFPAPKNRDGKRAAPFWSSRSRAEKIIATVPAYFGFVPFELTLDEFLARWVPGLTKDGVLVGVNWSGASATGFDVEPDRVVANIHAQSPL